MKKSVFQILAFLLLLIMGCSKDELINDASENNELKKGRVVSTIEFTSISIGTATLPLSEVGGQILRFGEFSGFIDGCGKINTSLSKYEFAKPVAVEYNFHKNPENQDFNYYISFTSAKIYLIASGKSSTATSDYCTIKIIEETYPYATYPDPYVNLWPLKWGADSYYGEEYFGGGSHGKAIITEAQGKLSFLNGKQFSFEKRPMMYDINLTTGYIKLRFYLKL